MSPLSYQTVLLTGASGGIGSEIAELLLKEKCRIGLVGRCPEKMQQLRKRFISHAENICIIHGNINDPQQRKQMLEQMQSRFGAIDILLNAAGAMDFTRFEQQDESRIEQIIQTNTLAPMKLCQEVLPIMHAQGQGHIVNIGSIFGSIGFAYFTTYSASKFALRGFSEALRRELADSPIKVSYIAPRAVRTRLNSEKTYAMAEAVKMNMDSPDKVAQQIVGAIKKQRKDVFLGFPEAFFVRVNAILPRLVDFVTKKQNRIAEKFV